VKRVILSLCLFLAVGALFGASHPVNAQTCDTNTVQGNCVLYARSQVSSLPYGLTTYASKLNIINHRFPRVGSVAVMPAPGDNAPYGHVAVVRNVAINPNGTLSLTIQESNWGGCNIYTRLVTPEARSIQGYFDPAYPSGQESPRLDSLSNAVGYSGQQFYISAAGAGFDTSTVQGIILGGWCDSFGKCAVPTGAIQNRTSTSLQVPVTLNSPGTYTLYLFNASSGKTSNGKQITIY
jgi:hypothetical protein